MTTIQDAGSSGSAAVLGPLRSLNNAFNWTIALMNSAGTLAVFCLMFLICADVFVRGLTEWPFSYVTNFIERFVELPFAGTPIRGANELVAYTIILAVFLQLAHSLHVGRFTRAEMFIEPLNNRRPIIGALYEAVFSIGGAFVFALICYGTYFVLVQSWNNKSFFGVQNDFVIPEWPLRVVILIGAGAVTLKYGVTFVEKISEALRLFKQRISAKERTAVGWRNLLVLGLLAVGFLIVVYGDFSNIQIGILGLAAMLAMIFLGVHIGVGLILISFAFIWIIKDGNPTVAINTVKHTSNEFLRDYLLGVVPLFVLMGLLINESGIGKDTFDVARWMLGKIRGGLGVATVVANAIFAAITGSSIASAAVFTKVATPHMREHGYTAKFAVGTVAGSSVLGMLIPPSLLLIVYALVSEQSIGALFIAAIIPGLILAFAMCSAIVGMSIFWPSYVGVPDRTDVVEENIRSAVIKLLPIIVLVAAVLGGIYGGLFTAIEAGAVGAAGALIVSILKRRLTIRKLWTVLIETGHTTVSVLFLILAARIYGKMLALSGFPQAVGELAAGAGFGFFGFMAFYVILVIILGMFLDSISMMLIVLPLVLPIIPTLGGDLVWFGIVTVIAVEMGLLTPPLGISVYVVRSTLNDPSVSLGQIFAGAFPFVIIMLAVTVLLIAVPEISLVFVR